MITLHHGRVELVLHRHAEGEGLPLVLLHGLGADADSLRAHEPRWRGPVYALDFSGHGSSRWLSGGGYHPELLAGDADVALAALGSAVLCGWGLGAWVALLLAGARPEQVPAALLLAGAGLDGGGAAPNHAEPRVWREPPVSAAAIAGTGPDPAALVSLGRDIRPEAYACDYARGAKRVVLIEDGQPRPPWWQAVAAVPGVEQRTGQLNAVLAELL
jgi:pimeloyl-ACP methyl ester carboxylesterase